MMQLNKIKSNWPGPRFVSVAENRICMSDDSVRGLLNDETKVTWSKSKSLHISVNESAERPKISRQLTDKFSKRELRFQVM